MTFTARMRDDLAQDGMSVPASRTFSNYDTLDDDLYITAQELEGAVQGDDPADPDDHPFCYVQLKDGRSLYFIKDDAIRIICQKTARIVLCKLSNVGVFKRHIMLVRKDAFGKRGFSTLARTRQSQYRVLPSQLF